VDFTGTENDGSRGDNWSCKDVQISNQIVITNIPTPTFYRQDALPVTQPAVTEH